MTGALLHVPFAGPLVSVQDAGRFGQMRFGVPASGPMDRFSHAAALAALGQPPGGVAIEVSLGGLTLECVAGAVSFAVTGGGFIIDHAGARCGSWMVRTLRAGEALVIRPGPWGSWAYLAFAATLDVPLWLGHAATHALSGLGGGLLRAGQTLRLRDARVAPEREGDLPCPVTARARHRARVVLGPQDRHFAAEARATLLDSAYALTAAYDRMGVRLAGPKLALGAVLSIPSEPVLRGSLQVAGDGVPTLLLADHQTTGGYPKIATLLADDVDGVVQLRPRDRLTFAQVSPEQAVALARRRALAKRAYLAGLAERAGG